MKRFLALLLALLLPCAALADTLTPIPSPLDGAAPVSLSPDGSTGVFSTSDGLAILREDGSMLPVTISETRGAADEYGNLAKLAVQGARYLGSEGLVWSPDGRYAAVVNQLRVVQTALFIFDPIVIDAQTGEIFLLASYANNIRKENAGAVLTCTFSADSRYLYAVILGSINNARFCLMQYDLATLEATVLHSWEDLTYWPSLVQLADGSFLLLKDTTRQHDFTGLVHITKAKTGYVHTITDFTQRMMFFYPRSMQYSASSGHALILSNSIQGSNTYSNLLHLRPDADLSAPEKYWAVTSLDSSYISVLSKNELQSPSDVIIHDMRLSPDGERALLLCIEDGVFALRMLTFADGALTPVTGVDSETLRSFCLASNPYFTWCGDVVILGASPTGAIAYKLN